MLEAAEGAMGSTEQTLELVQVKDLAGPLLLAVGSRLAAPLPPIPSLFWPSQYCIQVGSSEGQGCELQGHRPAPGLLEQGDCNGHVFCPAALPEGGSSWLWPAGG